MLHVSSTVDSPTNKGLLQQVKNLSAFCLSSMDMAVAVASDDGQRFQFSKQKATVYKITSFVRRTLACRAPCHLPPAPRCDTEFLAWRKRHSYFCRRRRRPRAAASLTRKLYVLCSPFLPRKPRRQWLANCSSVALSFCGGTSPVTLDSLKLCIGLTLSNLEFDSWMRLEGANRSEKASTHSFCQDEVRPPRPSVKFEFLFLLNDP